MLINTVLVLAALAQATAGLPTLSATGITQTVTSSTTLSQIVAWANTASSNVTITVQATTEHEPDNILSVSSQLVVTNPAGITIQGIAFSYQAIRPVWNGTHNNNVTQSFSCSPVLSFSQSTPLFSVPLNKALTLKGIGVKHSTHGVVALTGSGMLAENCTFSDNTGGVITGSGAAVILRNCVMNNNENSVGSTITLSASSAMQVSDCLVFNNSGAVHGGVVMATDSNLTFIGSTLSGNKVLSVSGSGGAISVNHSMVTMDESLVEGNHAGYGGGICAKQSSTVVLTDTSFVFNKVGAYGSVSGGGGAISVDNSALLCEEVSFLKNSASAGHGGAIHALSSPVNLSWSAFGQNVVTPPGKGAAVYITSSNFKVEGSTDFHSLEATHGAAIKRNIPFEKVGAARRRVNYKPKEAAPTGTAPGKASPTALGVPYKPNSYGTGGYVKGSYGGMRRLLYLTKPDVGHKLKKWGVHDVKGYYRIARKEDKTKGQFYIPMESTPDGTGSFIYAANVTYNTPSLVCTGCTITQ